MIFLKIYYKRKIIPVSLISRVLTYKIINIRLFIKEWVFYMVDKQEYTQLVIRYGPKNATIS